MKETAFYVAGLHCPAEELMVRNQLERLEGIEKMRFNLMTRELTVVHALEDQQLLDALKPLDLGVRLKGQESHGGAGHDHHEHGPGCNHGHDHDHQDIHVHGPGCNHDHGHHDHDHSHAGHDHSHHDHEGCCDHDHDHAHHHSESASHEHEHEHGDNGQRQKILLGVSGATAVAAEVVHYLSGEQASWPVIVLALISIVAGGPDTLRKGLVALRTFNLNISFLMMLAVVGAAIIGQWPEAAMVTFLFALAETIEGYSLDRARNAIRSLMALTPEDAEIQDGSGGWRNVPATQVAVGQVVRVRPGERVPLDGVVTAGSSSVNQAPITGESMPVEKNAGDNVFAGTVNERGSFEFRVTAAASDTTLARIIKTVQEAQSERAPTQRFVDSFARYYTPVVVLLAILAAVLPPLLFQQAWMPWIYKSLVMLVIACPCALVLSTPVTVVSGLAAAAHSGILIKGGVYLETGHKLQAIAFDKTGTLTQGRPEVTDIVPLDGEGGPPGRDEVLQLAASLDAPSEHPVATAILEAFDKNPNKLPFLNISGFEAIAGRGVKAAIGGRTYFIGNHRFAEENKVCGKHVEEVLDRLEAEGKTTVVLSTGERALAVIGVADTLRETSIEAIREMHALGVRTVLLTGDNQHTGQVIAGRVGIDDVRGDLLPEDKLTAIEGLLEKHGTVGMVGDGINDAPALARASMGFAMGAAGTDTAIETADVALMQDDLRKLPVFLRLSRRTSQVLAQNIGFAIGIKVIFFALALTGRATLWMAVFADLGASLIVVGNGLRLLRFRG